MPAEVTGRIEFWYEPTQEWVELDGSRVPLPLRITMGRSAAAAQPDPPAMQFSWLGPYLPMTFGTPVRFIAEVAGEAGAEGGETRWVDDTKDWDDSASFWGYATGGGPGHVRFVGEVSTMRAIEDGGEVVEWEVLALGTIAADGRKHIRTIRGVESEVDRVNAYAALAGLNINVVGSTALSLRADETNRSAIGAIHELCASTGALFWQGRDGALWYGLGDHRQQNAEWRIPDNAILDGVVWESVLDGVINELVITYGDAESPTQQTYRNGSSIDLWGTRAVSIDTLLADEVEANTLAFLIFSRRFEPFWLLSDIVVPVEEGDPASATAVNRMHVGDGVIMGIPTAPGEVGTVPDLWTVEGWVEEWPEGGGQTFQIAVTDRVKWGARALRDWQANAGHPWAFWINYSWLQALIIDEP
jgi:hypothetical protein